jgi:hypothetical protein
MSRRVESAAKDPYGSYDDFIIVVRDFPWWNPIAKLLRCPQEGTMTRYAGSCTVWHDADTGRRADLDTEFWLSNVWQRQQRIARGAR